MITKIVSRRLSLMALLGTLLWCGLGLRLVDLQITRRDAYLRRAEEQQRRVVTLPARRGFIFDRNLRALALNVGVDSYSVRGVQDSSASRLTNRQLHRFSRRLAELTHQRPDRLFVKMTDTAPFKWLARGVDPATSEQIQRLPFMDALRDRVHKRREVRRIYPYGAVAGQLTGFTDIDGKGLAGIEQAYDRALSGAKGFSVQWVDRRKRPYSRIDAAQRPPSDGVHLVLTIDAASQYAAEKTLRETIAHHKAKGGMILLLKPETGEILAMASAPSFDPNRPGAFPAESRKIRPVMDVYEPGSTFKLVTAAAALDTKRFVVTDSIFCHNGVLAVGNRTVTDHAAFRMLTFQGVIEHSSNVGTIKIAQQLGDRVFYRYARAFGFGSPTGVGLPGEARGVLLNPADWSATSLQTMAIGYGVSVTGLQLALAYGAVANGGLLMEPRIVKAVVHPDGTVEARPLSVVRRVMRPETARTLRDIFKGVVKRGTGVRAAVEGYQVAGKTGTAWKTREDGPGYTRNYRASFVGFFPADKPEVVALIVIDEPKEHGFYGGEVAAPAFRTLMKRLVDLPGGPVRTPPAKEDGLPRYLAALRDEAPEMPPLDIQAPPRKMPATEKIPVQDMEFDRLASRPIPSPGAPSVRLPSVIGLSLREAFARLAKKGFEVTVVGSGRVVRQIPGPGVMTAPGDRCLIEGRPFDTVAFAPSTSAQ